MKTIFALSCALFVAGTLFAQNLSIAKSQAKRAVGSESAGQQSTPPPAAPQPNPALQATLQNISSLRTDFEKFDSNPTNSQPLIKDLTEAAQGAKAKPASVASLAENLTTVVAGNKKLRAQHQKLAQNIHAIFNSSHLSPSQQQTMLDGVQKVLLDGGASAEDTSKVIGDLKKIAAETR